jgi:Subtilase family
MRQYLTRGGLRLAASLAFIALAAAGISSGAAQASGVARGSSITQASGIGRGSSITQASGVTRAYRNVSACARPHQAGIASCFAIRRQTMLSGRAVGIGLPSRGDSARVNGDAGFGATALRKAYEIRAVGSRNNVIAIVDATHSGTAFDDVSEYRKTFGLPALTDCTSKAAASQSVPSGKNACFIQLDQNGSPSRAATTEDAGWAQETALDLEMASAACPKCSLLLVEGATASFEDLSGAVGLAAAFDGVKAISNSYGGSDVSGAQFTQYSAAAAIGIAVTASSGDFGFGVEAPASFEGVVAVGGTSLTVDTNGTWLAESAWAGSGSGCSALNAKPFWQAASDTKCNGKLTADVAAVADPATGVSVYYNGGWYVFGGTSASAPLIAGLYALKHDFGASAGDFTATNAARLHDVTAGSNATSSAAKRACKVALWCTAGFGFDGPTGLGTPFGTGAF